MERTIARRSWPVDHAPRDRGLPVVPVHDDLRVVRIDMPCTSAGLQAPPCSIQAWFMTTATGHRLLVLCPPGRATHVARWLEAHGVREPTIEPGIAPRSLWAHLTALPQGWPDFLLDRAVQRIELTPEGTTSLFLEDTSVRTDVLVEKIQSSTTDAFAREALGPEPGDLLTARQKEVLAVAVASGYYEIPRRITLRGLAAAMELSPGATSELLRRGERTIISSFFDSGAASAWAWDTTE